MSMFYVFKNHSSTSTELRATIMYHTQEREHGKCGIGTTTHKTFISRFISSMHNTKTLKKI